MFVHIFHLYSQAEVYEGSMCQEFIQDRYDGIASQAVLIHKLPLLHSRLCKKKSRSLQRTNILDGMSHFSPCSVPVDYMCVTHEKKSIRQVLISPQWRLLSELLWWVVLAWFTSILTLRRQVNTKPYNGCQDDHIFYAVLFLSWGVLQSEKTTGHTELFDKPGNAVYPSGSNGHWFSTKQSNALLLETTSLITSKVQTMGLLVKNKHISPVVLQVFSQLWSSLEHLRFPMVTQCPLRQLVACGLNFCSYQPFIVHK